MKFLLTLNPENATEDEIKLYKTRTAVRAVVFDSEGKIAILNVAKQSYHKLPGGGIEQGENELEALRRECREELGCDIKIYGEVGEIIEYRKIFGLKQISSCYLAKVVGKKGTPEFTLDELADGFQVIWLPPKDAIILFMSETAKNDEGRLYIVPRDRTFLDEAIKSGGLLKA